MRLEPFYVHYMEHNADCFRAKLHAVCPEFTGYRSRKWLQRRLLHLAWLVFRTGCPRESELRHYVGSEEILGPLRRLPVGHPRSMPASCSVAILQSTDQSTSDEALRSRLVTSEMGPSGYHPFIYK